MRKKKKSASKPNFAINNTTSFVPLSMSGSGAITTAPNSILTIAGSGQIYSTGTAMISTSGNNVLSTTTTTYPYYTPGITINLPNDFIRIEQYLKYIKILLDLDIVDFEDFKIMSEDDIKRIFKKLARNKKLKTLLEK